MRNLVHLAVTTALAAIMGSNQGCLPPGFAQDEADYKAEIMACAGTTATPKDACFCRKAVDIKWGVCKRMHPDYPIGRCGTLCEEKYK